MASAAHRYRYDDEPVVGWLVRYPTLAGEGRALMLDEGRAVDAAARMHGTVAPLIERPPHRPDDDDERDAP